MNLQKALIPIMAVVLVAAGFHWYGWMGVAVVTGGLVMWVLLHFTRLMTILRRAADRPIGYVDSAVMLNAKLKRGMTLMHVIAMTRSLGQQLSPKDMQPERFRWSDSGESHVTCEFQDGKLMVWELVRPAPAP